MLNGEGHRDSTSEVCCVPISICFFAHEGYRYNSAATKVRQTNMRMTHVILNEIIAILPLHRTMCISVERGESNFSRDGCNTGGGGVNGGGVNGIGGGGGDGSGEGSGGDGGKNGGFGGVHVRHSSTPIGGDGGKVCSMHLWSFEQIALKHWVDFLHADPLTRP